MIGLIDSVENLLMLRKLCLAINLRLPFVVQKFQRHRII